MNSGASRAISVLAKQLTLLLLAELFVIIHEAPAKTPDAPRPCIVQPNARQESGPFYLYERSIFLF